MAKPTVHIVGAGLSGLALGRSLQQRGYSAVLYERSSSPPTHSYGITLYASTCALLSKVLGIEEYTLRSHVAVDAKIEGTGKIDTVVLETPNEGAGLRANRGKIEELLRQGLNVKSGHALQRANCAAGSAPILHFENGHTSQSDIVVGADGVHSTLRRLLLPETQLTILPFVVFNGKRRINCSTFKETVLPHMQDSTIVNFKHTGVRLNISVNEYKGDVVSVSWTYSRPVRHADDALHMPSRTPSNTTMVPDELFQELNTLHQSGLPQPFAEIFGSTMLRKDRILHWLMRTTHVLKEDLDTLARKASSWLATQRMLSPLLEVKVQIPR
jgi:2-polyprenyl-6-methoxyphenol hydroxylase-like FAD-dependent oxidoreductase